MKTVCEKDACVGCMECLSICSQNAIHVIDSIQSYNAVINTAKCIDCNRCHSICQNNRKLQLYAPVKWYQGWSRDDNIRARASSGGLASALAIGFIKNGGLVCSCTFIKGQFRFYIAKTIEEAANFSGSKYVKSNPAGIYKEILSELKKNNRRVLFIGLPCQAEAVRHFVGEKYRSLLYTVDLICHGTPSPKLLKDYFKKYKYNIDNIQSITFRKKDDFELIQDSKYTAYPGTVDYYSLAFLCALDYTDNCYQCRYAGLHRGSDLTLGDSWGSELPKEEQKKGISLILCQNEKGNELLKMADVELKAVDLKKAVSFNHQLREPCSKTKKVNQFFHKYHGNFHEKVFRILTWKCVKQFIKGTLIKTRIWSRGGVINYTISVAQFQEEE